MTWKRIMAWIVIVILGGSCFLVLRPPLWLAKQIQIYIYVHRNEIPGGNSVFVNIVYQTAYDVVSRHYPAVPPITREMVPVIVDRPNSIEAEPDPHQNPYHIDGSCIQNHTIKKTSEEIVAETQTPIQFEMKVSTTLQSTLTECPTNALNLAKRMASEQGAEAFESFEVDKNAPETQWKFTDVSVKRCAIVHNANQSSDLILLRLVVPRPESRRSEMLCHKYSKDALCRNYLLMGDPELLSFIQIDREGKPTTFLRQYVSAEYFGDSSRKIDVQYICDRQGAGFIDVVLNDQWYAGGRNIILDFTRDFSRMNETETPMYSGEGD